MQHIIKERHVAIHNKHAAEPVVYFFGGGKYKDGYAERHAGIQQRRRVFAYVEE